MSNAQADEITSGKFPDGGTWAFNRTTHTLLIDGVNIPNYENEEIRQSDIAYFPYTYENPFGFTSISVVKGAPWIHYLVHHLIISPTVEKIGRNAFSGCYHLKDVTFLERTGNYSTVMIDTAAFRDCWALNEFDFRYVSGIKCCAFQRSGLKEVELTAVQNLGWLIFADCPNLVRSYYTHARHEEYNIEPSIRILTPTKPKTDGCLTRAEYGSTEIVPVLILYGQKDEWKVDPTLTEKYFRGGVLGTNSKTGKRAYWYMLDNQKMIFDFANINIPMYENANVVPWCAAKNEKWLKEIHFYNTHGVPPFAFKDFWQVQTVTLNPEALTIGANAFQGCVSLYDINLGNVLAVPDEAFKGCSSLARVTMGNVIGIGKYAFEGCEILAHIEIGKDLNNLGNGAFYGIAGGDIHLGCPPPSGDRLGTDIFTNISNPTGTTLYVPAAYANLYKSTDPWRQFKQEIETEYPYKADGWMVDKSSSSGDLWLYITDKKVLSKNYTSPDQTPWYGFRDLIVGVDMRDEAGAEIGDYAFCGMSNLKHAYKLNPTTRIGKCAFKNCTKLIDPWFQTDDGDYICGKIEESAFENCRSFKSICFGTTLSSIGSKAFKGCDGLEQIYCVAKNPPTLAGDAFDNPGLVLMRVPEKLFLSYILADNWNYFMYEFGGKHGNVYTSGKFHNGYYILHEDGFLYCWATENSGAEEDLFGENRIVYAPMVDSIEVAGEIKQLSGEFADLANLKSVVLSPYIEQLDSTFKNCKKLKKVELMPLNGIRFGKRTFYNCNSLSDISFSNVTEIGEECFYYATSLTELNLPSVNKIDPYAFMGCSSLKYADIYKARDLGKYAFYFCSKLEWAKINACILQSGTFENCTNFKSLYLGARMTDIWPAFAGTALSDIHYTRAFPADVTESTFNNMTLSNIKLYVPKPCIDTYKKFDGWKDMNIQADQTLDNADWTLPKKGYFNDNNSYWELDGKGNLKIYVNGSQSEWPKLNFNVNYDHPLNQWMLYFSNVEIYGENAKTMQYLLPGWAGFNSVYEGIKTITLGSGMDSLGYQLCPYYRKLTDVYCYTEDVPNGKSAFVWERLDVNPVHVKLHVLQKSGVKEKFEADPNWKKFAQIVADLGDPTYVVTLEGMGCTIEVQESNVDLHAVAPNTVLHLTAVPSEGFRFVMWDNYDPSTGLTVTDNITVTAICEQIPEEDTEVGYECDLTTIKTKHSAYGDSWTYDEIWTVLGGANNNGAWDYAKMGGKKTTLANTNPVYVVNALPFTKAIQSVNVSQSGAIVNGSSIDEWGVKVYKDKACTQLLYTVKGGDITEGGEDKVYTVSAEEGKPWSSGYYIMVYWKLTNNSNSNGVFRLNKIEYMVSTTEEETETTYTVRFLNYNGDVLQSTQVAQGMMPVYTGTQPTRPSDGSKTYVFSGWSPAINPVTGDVDYTAQFTDASATGIENAHSDTVQGAKVFINGTLYILRGEHMYDAQGKMVK